MSQRTENSFTEARLERLYDSLYRIETPDSYRERVLATQNLVSEICEEVSKEVLTIHRPRRGELAIHDELQWYIHELVINFKNLEMISHEGAKAILKALI